MWDPKKLTNNPEEVERSSAWRARIYHTTVHNGERRFEKGDDQTTTSDPVRFTLGGINRMRYELSLRHEDISVMDVPGRGTKGGSSFRSSLSGRHSLEFFVFNKGGKKEKEGDFFLVF